MQLQLSLPLQLQLPLAPALPLQLQLHYTALHPAVVVEVTIATIPKAQLQPPFGPAAVSLCHPCVTTTKPLP